MLTPNETELRALAGLAADAQVAESAQALLARGPRAVLVTLGAAGCQFGAGQPPRSLAARVMPVTDTIGAGDTFTGALAAALARGEPLQAAMRCANERQRCRSRVAARSTACPTGASGPALAAVTGVRPSQFEQP